MTAVEIRRLSKNCVESTGYPPPSPAGRPGLPRRAPHPSPGRRDGARKCTRPGSPILLKILQDRSFSTDCGIAALVINGSFNITPPPIQSLADTWFLGAAAGTSCAKSNFASIRRQVSHSSA
ncbi:MULTISPECIES: hypothetical protein [Methylobacterium]|uniref:hypothetical protein n=1 Tax=Methylobacterium TaxID=407 RepID=UPI0011C9BFD2|nr:MULTISPECIES: hypothetical protein [Methylobacterium]TXN20621.1 hypothetical protein FV217_17375 [Methylobacterium sp. WL9]